VDLRDVRLLAIGLTSISLLRWLLPPLAFVWTSNKLLVLDSLLVNSVKLNLLVLELDWRGVVSSETLPGTATAPISMLKEEGKYWMLWDLCDMSRRIFSWAVCGRAGGVWTRVGAASA
jgi:hypothetical protein